MLSSGGILAGPFDPLNGGAPLVYIYPVLLPTFLPPLIALHLFVLLRSSLTLHCYTFSAILLPLPHLGPLKMLGISQDIQSKSLILVTPLCPCTVLGLFVSICIIV